MTTKLSISFTDTHAQLIEKAVESGQFASASEVVRTATRKWATDEELGRLWDEGLATGFLAKQRTMSEIKAEAKARPKRSAK
ncbi:MAG: type II toxin-antitoxin system ParD family antitoxin [Alphaproteobacteria bacterium]|jgi:antitoxin ParD1/3/4|nr:MAG: type II toxin-antitoxin system ParD family antitoxin [Alphaproteobacteria bacterium]